MFLKYLKHHGHGHGHKKMHKHGGKHEKIGHHFKHPAQHMGNDFFRGKYHRGLDFDRGCFSESELPDTTKQNVEAEAQDIRTFLSREFHKRRHHWIREKCCCGKNGESDQNSKNNEEGNALETPAENTEPSNVLATSTENKEGQDKTEVCCYKGWHYFRHHGGRRHHEFNRSCPRCDKKEGETTENEATTDGEKGEEKKEGEKEKEGYVRKYFRGHYKGKRGYGFRKCCQEESGTENEDTTGDEGGVRYGHIRKHHRGPARGLHGGPHGRHHEGPHGRHHEGPHGRHHEGPHGRHYGGHHGGPHGGHHGEPHGGHHGGRRGHKMRKGCPKCFQELVAAGNELGPGTFEERRHHGGKWGHGPHGKHHEGWKRHGCCIVMVDAAANTGESEIEGNAIQEVVEDLTEGQNMEQDCNPEVGQEQTQSENDQVLEVANNLSKSSLE